VLRRAQGVPECVAVLKVLEAHEFLVTERERVHDLLRHALAAGGGNRSTVEQHHQLVVGAEKRARLALFEAQTLGQEAEDVAADGGGPALRAEVRELARRLRLMGACSKLAPTATTLLVIRPSMTARSKSGI
jgi:hypothetical protein